MADFTVPVTVTRNSTSCVADTPNCFTWQFDGNQLLQSGSNFAMVPENTTKTIEITLQATTSGDSVVFQDPPLQFTLADGTLTTPPSGLTIPSGGSSSLTITDDNDPAPTENQTVRFRIKATYTPSGGTGIAITSPDPTIVNAGTGG